MMTKKKIGGYEYNYQVNRGLRKCQDMRQAIRKIVEGRLGAQAQAITLTKAALSLGEVEEIFHVLDDIGAAAKIEREE